MIFRCLLACFCALAFAQPKEPAEIRCVFRALAWNAPLEDAAYEEGRRHAPFLVPADFFSAPRTYRGAADVRFGRLTADQPAPPNGPDGAALETARLADAAYAELAQAAARLVAGAPEGPQGEARRQQAEELLTKAAEQAARANAAREQARRAPAPKPPSAESRGAGRPAKELRFVERGQVRLKDGGRYLLLFAETADAWRITALEESAEAHPFGTIRLIHCGDRPLRLVQGGRTYPLLPGRPLVLSPATDEHGYAGLELRPADPAARPLRTMRVFPEKDARSTYLIGELPTGGLNVKAAHERRAP